MPRRLRRDRGPTPPPEREDPEREDPEREDPEREDKDKAVGGRAPHACQILSDRRGNTLVVWVAGSLDWTTVGPFDALMDDHDDAQAVIVDLSEARLDAAGSGALVTAVTRAHQRKRQLVLVVTDSVLRAVLITIGLNLVVPVVSSEPEAIDWLELHGIPTAPGRTSLLPAPATGHKEEP